MSFGFGIGDLVAVVKLADKIRERFVDAPSDYKSVRDDVTVDEIKTEVDRLHERQDDREQQQLREKVLDWLSTVDYHAQQRDAICQRQEGTGQWLLTSKEYKSWLETPGSTLFCPGMPGAGKTIMCAIMIEALHKLAAADPDNSLQINIVATSRDIFRKTSLFNGCVRTEIRATSDDVHKYVTSRIPELLDGLVMTDPQLVEQVSQRVVESTEGMFLLAQLHMDSLKERPTKGHLKRALGTLPQGSERLHKTYDLAMVRINSQSPDKAALANNILQWVVHSVRPLSVPELLDAVAIQPETKELDEDFRPCREDLDSLCMGLVTIDPTLRIVRLVHYTTKEYFERRNVFPEAHSNIARTCATYLSFDCIVREYLDLDCIVRKPLQRALPRSWSIHAAKVDSSVAVEFLRSSPDVLNAFWDYIRHPLEYDHDYIIQNLPRYDDEQGAGVSLCGAHLAALFGFEDALITLIEDGQSPDIEDSYGMTPLFYATWENQASTATCLVYRYTVDVNHRACDGRTPLMHAAKYGSLKVSRVLIGLKKTDINVVPGLKDWDIEEVVGPLLEAILHRNLGIATLFIRSE
ncbi:uncharacterized protein N0V89_006227 [Didymosphaeria variabile]|uniref:Ankyrin n=1 Tax=Didymosphaeria variabile TaxID=1932322 RepID=A0A9W8XM54_9PLEO|nr:uncharacterized protein N0V89_006227 [Didymosphaeria variabile]KAJ4354490.1 hypothetical protein N0V89_006227 [Didymosphaeria variabile]